MPACPFLQKSMTNNTRTELQRLLQLRIEHPEQATDIDQQIHATFDCTCAIAVLDLSGFSRLTIRHGIIHFLSMVHRMTAIATPIVQQQQGRVVKQEADNLFAVFDSVEQAVVASTDILKAFAIANISLPDEHDLHASIGIGYGTVLNIANEDLFGSEMNLASKLGEDLARPGEILLTEAAFRHLPQPAPQWQSLELSISGMTLIVHKLG